MKKLVLVCCAVLFSLSLVAETKKTVQLQKIPLLSDVFLVATWGDSINADSFYSFQLTGHTGKIANMKVALAQGTLDRTADNNYRVKIDPEDKEMQLTITKLDPITKQSKVLKQIIVPVKKKK